MPSTDPQTEALRHRLKTPLLTCAGHQNGHSERVSAALSTAFILVLAWAPLPLASNRPWSWSLLGVLVAGLLLGTGVLALWGRVVVRFPATVIVAGLLVTIVFGWIIAQTQISAPPLAHPVFGELTSRGFQTSSAISIDPSMTWQALMRAGTAVGVFVLALIFAQDEVTAGRMSRAFVFIATGYAIYGLLRLWFGWDILIWDTRTNNAHVTGTFVNRNNFATFANLAVIVGLATLLKPLFRPHPKSWQQTWRELVAFAFEQHGLLLSACVVLVVASLLSGSRGGLLSLTAALVFLLVSAVLKGRPRGAQLFGVLTLMVVISFGLLHIAGSGVLARLGEVPRELANGEGRLSVWDLALQMLGDRPIYGHGYGTFETTFTLYRDARFSKIYDFAHNTYLEDAVGLGLPATLIWYTGMLCLFTLCIRGFARRRRDQNYPLAAAATSVLVGVHALVDFSIQIPAVAVSYAAILGIGCAHASRSTNSGSPRPATAILR